MINVKCCVCDETFGVQEETVIVLERTGQTFYCPFGHKQHFPKRHYSKVEDPSAEVIPFKIIDGDKD